MVSCPTLGPENPVLIMCPVQLARSDKTNTRHALGIQSQVQNWRRGKYDFDIEVMTQEKNQTQLE